MPLRSAAAVLRGVVAFVFILAAAQAAAAQKDPLPSWNDTAVKTAIMDFVARVTDKNGPGYVPPEERIATFDHDGTLWVEQPMYTQMVFIEDQAERLSAKHPEWKSRPEMKALLDRDRQRLIDLGSGGFTSFMAGLLGFTLAGMSGDEFDALVEQWTSSATHPRFKQLYIDCTYVPQIELMNYLRANDFKVFIVSSGDIAFSRSWSDKAYGVAPPRIVGLTVVMSFALDNGTAKILRQPTAGFVEDGVVKPEGIYLHIGQRPIFAFGNAGDDRQMLEYTRSGSGERMALILHHDDAEREYAYGPAGGLPNTGVGVFPQDLMDEARTSGWHVVSMKNDWKRIFSFEEPGEEDAAAVRPATDTGEAEESVRKPS